jgi:hypothetical protein
MGGELGSIAGVTVVSARGQSQPSAVPTRNRCQGIFQQVITAHPPPVGTHAPALAETSTNKREGVSREEMAARSGARRPSHRYCGNR